jgi:hypothetical protein
MAGLDLTPIEGGRHSRTPIEQIDPVIGETVEEAYAFCKANAGSRVTTPSLGSKEAAEFWLSDARAYAYQREAGRLVVTGNTDKEGRARFSVSEYLAPVKVDE